MIGRLTLAWLGLAAVVNGDVPRESIQAALAFEAHRIEAVARVSPSVVCIFDEEQSGGGSGVLIDEEGYGLTNYHVVMGMMKTRAGFGGLSDGELYPLTVLGIDVTGDVAMFRLTGRDRFPFAELGDSSTVRAGDAVIAMGNPFVLSEDYTPTVTTGIVTGIHRYQGEGETLVYTDAIQTDAAINPGNSGGPLFDADGRVIGINGRISAEMHKYARGRFNVGLGYAININQIRRFIPSLRAGLLARHGSPAATVIDDTDGVIFNDMYENGPAWSAGVRVGNRLLRLGGVDITSANQFLGIIGTYPEDWPVAISFDSFGRVVHKVVRLEPVNPPMRGPFRVETEFNHAALERLLSGFRERVGAAAPAARWRIGEMTVTQIQADARDVSYRLRFADDDAVEHTELSDAGDPVRTQSLNITDGQWTEDGRRSTASTEEVLYYAGLNALVRKLLGGGDFWKQQGGVHHAGADAVVDMDDRGTITRERLLEAAAMSLTEDVSFRGAFDVESHLPARIVVRDEPTALEVEVILSDETDFDGVRWPRSWSVRSAHLSFEVRVQSLKADM